MEREYGSNCTSKPLPLPLPLTTPLGRRGTYIFKRVLGKVFAVGEDATTKGQGVNEVEIDKGLVISNDHGAFFEGDCVPRVGNNSSMLLLKEGDFMRRKRRRRRRRGKEGGRGRREVK